MSKLIKFSLVAVLSLGLMPNTTFAQDSVDDDVEEIIVTGSKIKRSNLDSSKPLEIISEDAIERTGLNNLGDVLQNITSSDGSGIRPVSTSTNGGIGANEISLRNLGAGRTLVLVDGRRWAADENGIVDMNTIPVGIISRVEILKDGASSIYGSDAVAGVINVITKKEYDGFSVSASQGEYDAGYGENNQLDLLFGATSEKSSTLFNFSYSSQEGIFGGDIPRASVAYQGCTNPPGSGTGPENSPTNLGPNNAQNSGFGNFAPDTSVGVCGSSRSAYGRFFVPGISGSQTLIPGQAGTDPSHFTPFTAAGMYNFAPINHVQLPVERVGAYNYSQFDISDNMTASVQFTYTQVKATNQIAQVPMTVEPSAGPQWQIPISADSVFNVFNEDISHWRYRSVPFGARKNDYDHDIFGARFSLDGNFEMNDGTYFWSVGYQVNDASYDQTGYNYINLANLRNAVGPSFQRTDGSFGCGTPDATIAGCTPLNVFGGPDMGLSAGVITPNVYDQMVSYVGYTLAGQRGFDSEDFWAEISGPMFEMPYGTAYFAAGYEIRNQGYYERPDPLVAGGLSSTNFTEPTRGNTGSEEWFVELNFPLLNGVVGAKELELTVSARNSEFTSSGIVGSGSVSNSPGEPSTVEIGVRWRPIDDVLVRFTSGETFVAPAVGTLYAGAGESFPSLADPCNTVNFPLQSAATQSNCVAGGVPAGGAPQLDSQLRELRGGNPLLKPEEGENMTLGVVYTPSQIEGLSVVVDAWAIELNNIVAGIGAGQTISRCYVESAVQDDAFCSFVVRTPSGSVQEIRSSSVNAAVNNVEGVDLGIRYEFDVDNYGSFVTAFDMTYYTKDEFAQSETSTPSERFGYYEGSVDWRWRANAGILWAYGDFTTSVDFRILDDNWEDCWLNYYYGLDAQCSHPDKGDYGYDLIKRTIYTDLQVNYQYSDEVNVFIGARNLTGKEPPYVQDSFSHSFDMAYDLPGGAFVYAGFKIEL